MAGIALLPYLVIREKSLPDGMDLASPAFAFDEARLLVDRTVWDPENGEHRLEHENFDALLQMVADAEEFLLLDFFLWHPWRGKLGSDHELRPLAAELAEALRAKRREHPDLPILVLTDPINRLYGRHAPEYFDRLTEAGIPVVFTDLSELPDSNWLYAPQARFWSRFLNGDGEGKRVLPNPLDPEGGRLTVGEASRLLYFKANHRKVAVAGGADGPDLFVSSFNPADGSANHSNLGVRVRGGVAAYAADAELTVAEWSAGADGQVHGGRRELALRTIEKIRQRLPALDSLEREHSAVAEGPRVSWRSEAAIREEIVKRLDRAGEADRVDVAIFYLSDRKVIRALKEAARRGAALRLLMDANRDAFGRKKIGIPNRPVAAELMDLAEEHEVTVRWAVTHGEQFHPKVLRIQGADTDLLFLGSANWTRRNLANLNLEANVLFEDAGALAAEFDEYFDSVWNNRRDSAESRPYSEWAEQGWSLTWKKYLYRFQEWSGASTF